MKTKKLVELAKTIRSKNAGPDKITFDIIFREKEVYDLVKKSKVLTPGKISKLFEVSGKRVSDFVEFDPANAFKFTIYRKRPSGSPGETDVFGCQQYPPLLDVEIPLPSPKKKRKHLSPGASPKSRGRGSQKSSSKRTKGNKR
jgi:hypothetical protein